MHVLTVVYCDNINLFNIPTIQNTNGHKVCVGFLWLHSFHRCNNLIPKVLQLFGQWMIPSEERLWAAEFFFIIYFFKFFCIDLHCFTTGQRAWGLLVQDCRCRETFDKNLSLYYISRMRRSWVAQFYSHRHQIGNLMFRKSWHRQKSDLMNALLTSLSGTVFPVCRGTVVRRHFQLQTVFWQQRQLQTRWRSWKTQGHQAFLQKENSHIG